MGHLSALPVWNASEKGFADLSVSEAVGQLCARMMTAVEYAKSLLQAGDNWQCANAFAELQVERVRQCPEIWQTCHPVTLDRPVIYLPKAMWVATPLQIHANEMAPRGLHGRGLNALNAAVCVAMRMSF